MSNDVTELDAAFAAFRAATVPQVKPAGIDQARATARHRRRVRSVALAAVAVVLVSIPASIYVAFGSTHATPAPFGGTSTGTASPSVAPSTSEPSLSPEVPVECGAAAPTGPAVPSGGIEMRELCNATLTLPAWPGRPDCVSGKVQFKGGSHFIGDSFHLNIGSPNLASDASIAYADVNHDGDAETLLLLSCGGEGWASEVLAMQRTSGAAIGALARVVATGGEIKRLMGVAGNADGTVRVEVGDWNGGLGDDGSLSQRQWRTYGWDGREFTQVAGPRSFPVNARVTDLAVTATALAFGPPTGAGRTGSIKVTVTNRGPSAAPYWVSVDVPSYAQPSAMPVGCRMETFPQPVITVACSADALPAGSTSSLTLIFQAPDDADGITVELVPTAGVSIADGYGDPTWSNNQTDVRITFA